MKLTRDWAPAKYPVHCCLFDKECRQDYRDYHSPLRLYLHFIVLKDGSRAWLPLWGERRHNRWLTDLIKNSKPTKEPDWFVEAIKEELERPGSSAEE